MKTSLLKTALPTLIFALLLFAGQSLAQGTTCCNILTNGDFEFGDTDFSSDIPQGCACAANSYCVGTNFQIKCAGWPNLADHTSGSGNFLIIDGNAGGPADVWQYPVQLNASTTYCFSFWTANVYGNSFDLGLTVDGVLVPGGLFTVQGGAVWRQHTFTLSGQTGSTIAIRQMTGGGQRDFGIDDIEFGAPINANFTATPDANCGMNVAFTNLSTGPAVLSYNWDFGDQTASQQQSPIHQYANCGTYDVCLTVTRGECVDTICKTIVVQDLVPPVAACLGVGVVLDADCTYPITPALIDGGSSDNCYIASMSVSPTVITKCGLTPVTLTVTDSCGNSDQCTVDVQATEDVPPAIVCPPSLTVAALLPACSAVVKDIKYVLANDNCGPPTVTYTATNQPSGQNDASGLTYNQGPTTITYTASDGCGNTATCSFTLTVVCDNTHCACTNGDEAGPNLILNGDFSAGNTGFSTDYAPFFIPGTVTAIGRYSVLYSTQVPLANSQWGATDPSGLATGKFLVSDGAATAGQVAWRSQTIATTPGAEYNFCFSANNLVLPNLNYDDVILQVFINNNPVTAQVTLSENPAGWTPITATWTATASAVIEIRAMSPQSIGNDFAIDDIKFNKCSEEPCIASFQFTVSPCGSVQFTDQSDGVVPLSYAWNFNDPASNANNTSSAQNPTHQFTTCRAYNVCLTVTAANGCTSTICQMVTVSDLVAPVVTCRRDTILFARALPCSQLVGGLQYLSATDNCQLVSTGYTITGATTGSGQNNANPTTFNSGMSTVTYTAIDWCGNSGTCSFKVTVFCDTLPCACPAAGIAGANLVTNGSFTAGNAGFGSQLTSSNSCGAGRYRVADNFQTFCPQWITLQAYTLPNFLILDGRDNGNMPTVLWKTPVNLSTNTNYCFSFQWASVFANPPQSFQVSVDIIDNLTNLPIVGIPSFGTVLIQGPAAIWTSASLNWTSGSLPSGTYHIAIRQLTGDQYRDFGIDDICLRGVTAPCTADAGPDVSLCRGQGSVTLTATGGGTYLWTPGGFNTPSITVSPNNTTTYTVSVTNPGCAPATDQVTVTVNSVPTAAITGNLTICNGQSTTLTASGGGTYSWSSGGSTSAALNVNPSTTTTYTVSVTANGCTSTAQATVVVNALPTAAIAGNLTVCNGQSTTLTASGGGTYSWSSGGSTSAALNVNPSTTTTYTVSVTANGCTSTAQATVVVNALPTASIAGNLSICTGQSTTLTASGGGTYAWGGGGSTSASLNVNPSTTTTYTVSVTANGCTSTAQATVVVNPLPTAAITGNLSICNGQSTTLTASGGGTYAWSGGGSTGAALNVSPSTTTTYTVSVTANGCTSTAQATVVVNALPTASIAGNLTICNGQSTTLTASGGGTYAWSGGGSTSTSLNVNLSTTTTYTVSVTANGCTSTAQATVVVNALPTAAIAGNLSICTGQSTTLTASGGGTYAWSGGGSTGAALNVSPSTTTTYTVSVTANGCTSTAQATVVVNPLPTAAITGNLSICNGQSTTLTASGGSTYSWSGSGSTNATLNVSPSTTITYTVSVTAHGCTSTAQATVTVVNCDSCPDNLVKNGNFELGTPSGTDESIGLATDWMRIWPVPFGQSTADYWNTGAQNPTTGIGLATPTPALQGKFAGFWLHNTTDLTWREGILGHLTAPIPQNSGQYDLQMKIACLDNSLAGASMSVYGIPTGAGTALTSTNSLTGNTPLNVNLFIQPSVLLATYAIPSGCNAAFIGQSFLPINSSLFPAQGIDRIFLTRTDGVSGKAYVAIDDICLTKVSDPVDSCVCNPNAVTTLTAGGVDYTIGCAHGPFTPSIGCPVGPVTITSDFGCVSTIGGPCPPSTVFWELITPTGTVIPGSMAAPIALSFTANQVSAPGGYTLILTTVCSGSTDTCVCRSGWVQESCDTICPGCPPNTIQGPDLVANGDFSAGPFFFGTGYSPYFVPTTFTAIGAWSVLNGTQVLAANNQWGGAGHTTGLPNDNFLVADGGFSTSGVPAWSQTVSVQTGRSYNFCVFVNNLVKPPPTTDYADPVIEVWINGIQVAGPITVTELPDNWVLITTPWASGVQTSASIEIFSTSNEGIGNDFALDDISLRECQADTCGCGIYDYLSIRSPQGAPNQQLSCGDTATIICQPNVGVSFSGAFACEGGACVLPTQMDWELYDAAHNLVASGPLSPNPYFGLTLLPAYFQTSGVYELHLIGHCGGSECPCIIYLSVEACPTACPCTFDDIQALQTAVNAGFAQATSTTNCQACFSPLALSDCESVEWHLNTAAGPLLGTSLGNQTFCHNFNSTGAYTIVMVVTRLKANGTPCETFVYSKTINIICVPTPVCDNSTFKNPTFSIGAVAGGINSTGASEGWYGPCGEPVVLHEAAGSLDGWSIQLRGNLDSADVLGTVDAVCLEKGMETISLRFGIREKGIKSTLAIQIYQGEDFEMNECDGSSCFEIAALDLSPLDTGWYDLEVSFDLGAWTALDSCGDSPHGVLVRPAVFVTNALGSDQGVGTNNHSEIWLDHLCFDATTVAVNSPLRAHDLRIFPNPHPGTFQVELSELAQPGLTFRILDPTGRLVMEKQTQTGSALQTVQADNLPSGLYFLQVLSEGRVVAVEKFVQE